jgi:hypothetical protein
VGLAIFREGNEGNEGERILNHGFHGWARIVERVESMAFYFRFSIGGRGILNRSERRQRSEETDAGNGII